MNIGEIARTYSGRAVGRLNEGISYMKERIYDSLPKPRGLGFMATVGALSLLPLMPTTSRAEGLESNVNSTIPSAGIRITPNNDLEISGIFTSYEGPVQFKGVVVSVNGGPYTFNPSLPVNQLIGRTVEPGEPLNWQGWMSASQTNVQDGCFKFEDASGNKSYVRNRVGYYGPIIVLKKDAGGEQLLVLYEGKVITVYQFGTGQELTQPSKPCNEDAFKEAGLGG